MPAPRQNDRDFSIGTPANAYVVLGSIFGALIVISCWLAYSQGTAWFFPLILIVCYGIILFVISSLNIRIEGDRMTIRRRFARDIILLSMVRGIELEGWESSGVSLKRMRIHYVVQNYPREVSFPLTFFRLTDLRRLCSLLVAHAPLAKIDPQILKLMKA